MPLGFVTELHGWWHLFTGIGVYDYIVFIEYLRSYIRAVGEKSNTASKPILVWRSSFSLPYLVQGKK
jgi:dihydroceramidase